MKRCTYCGKDYPDEAEICAIDQGPLQAVSEVPEVPDWPSDTTLRQQLVAMKLSDDFDAAVGRRDQRRMYSILIQIGMKEKSASFVVRSTLAQLRRRGRPPVTRSSQAVGILVGLTLLGLGIYGFPFIVEPVKSGWTYSFGLVFDDTTKIYRSSSPVAFWIHAGFYMVSGGLMIAFGILSLIGVVIDQKRKLAEAAKKAKHDA
jgi:hypothetical protein